MASSPTSAPTAGVPAATTHNPTATPKRSVSKYCVPTTSAVPCAGCHAPAASLGRPSPVGSKKEAALPGLSETLAEPDPAEAAPAALELDELWSFVLKRANKRWIRVAPPRATRQVVAYAVGGRSRATCRKLWAAAPEAYRRAHCLSDFREAYQLVIPSEQRTAAGKKTYVLFEQPESAPLDDGGAVYSTTVNTYNALDQLRHVREYKGSDTGGGAFQETLMYVAQGRG